LDGQGQQRVVAPTDPGVAVGDGEDRLDLRFGQELDDPAVETFLRDRQHPCDLRGVLGMSECGVAEQ